MDDLGHEPATLLAERLAELRDRGRQICAAWRLTPAQRELMLTRNAVEMRDTRAKFRAVTAQADAVALASPAPHRENARHAQHRGPWRR